MSIFSILKADLKVTREFIRFPSFNYGSHLCKASGLTADI